MSDLKELSATERAAIVITALGTENAAFVYKHLNDDEVERLTYEVSTLPFMDGNTVQGVLEDFYELCLTQKVITDGGVDYARDVLHKAFGPEAAERLMAKIQQSMQAKAFDFVRKSDYKNLLAIVQNEYPQTIALILSYANAEQASAVLSELPKEKRVDVVERIANMDSASPETIKAIESTLERKFAAVISMDTAAVGGINYVADVLNKVDRSTEKYIFDELSVRNPALVDEIKKKMFVFEDILGLDSMAIQRFIRDCETKDLAVAIKGSNSDVAAALFANMPQRMQESIQQEIEYLHNVRMHDVEEAQQRIVGIIRHLEEEGELVIGKGGEDEIIA
ncbi:MAG: flagellar motor switch protein FliG [Oscillospiraceae bacterium]|nr:flagellar motor switch protein FliG [Oscillospiraceae bacterium]MBQ4311741.1 flagellar motor switch protein FliG [Oscillospiraceae bacterium]MBQ5418343.1 flagellar motor switch protein FliG [Oscillospiraceae bacterium]MCR5168780.1 flagellar motor switch protein FliG [Oscillospiraceae bacterium]